MKLLKNKKLAFIGGLHRSGTSYLHNLLKSQSDISGFSDTGIFEDEGQHLQTVLKNGEDFGGPGRFGFDKNAYYNEKNELITDANKQKLIQEWSNYWDMNKPILVEKSPPNLIRTSFLQAMFPNSYFLVIIRHPIPVSFATWKWCGTSIDSLIEHWLICHEYFYKEKSKLKNVLILKYEELNKSFNECINKISEFLNTNINVNNNIFLNRNEKYFKSWNEIANHNSNDFVDAENIIEKYEGRVNKFNYSLSDLEMF